MLERRTELLSSGERNDPEMVELTAALSEILSSGTRVRRLQLGSTQADDALARQLLETEPVNPQRTEREGERRFAQDRRVELLVHPGLANRPLAVVWVALCTRSPESLGAILDPDTPTIDHTRADTAVFYSIWTIEPGLRGLGVAGRLIAGATGALRDELPELSTMTTMSPIPGFRRWLDAQPTGGSDPRDGASLLGSCARYLVGDPGTTPQKRSDDPVARFHMGNGARLWRLLENADSSELGIPRSYGVMANYRYEPEDLAANRAVLDAGEPALGSQVAELLARG